MVTSKILAVGLLALSKAQNASMAPAPKVTPLVTLPDLAALRQQNNYFQHGFNSIWVLSTANLYTGGQFIAQGQTGMIDDGGIVIVDQANITWMRIFEGPVSVLWYGADPTLMNDSSAAFEGALAYASNSSNSMIIPAGQYLLASTLAIPEEISVTGEGSVTLDFRNLTNQTAIQIGRLIASYNSSGPESDGFHAGKLSNLLMIGNNQSDAVFVNGPNINDASVFYTLEKLDIRGFNNGIIIGNYTWLTGIFSCAIQNYTTYGFWLSSATDEGEELSIYNTAIFNGATPTAIGAYIDRGSNVYGDVYFFGSSFDYNSGRALVVKSGQVRFFGCHFEGDNSVVIENGYVEFFGCWFLTQGFQIDGGKTNFFGGYLPASVPLNMTNMTAITNYTDIQT